MRIAITQRATNSDKTKRLDSLEQNYVKFFQSFGVTLIPIPNCLLDPIRYLKNTKATHLILSGGGDIYPKLYKGRVLKDVQYSLDRDKTEKKLLNYATTKKIPVLGICRGCQFINVYFGGKLIQNLEKNFPGTTKHVKINHKIKILDIAQSFSEKKTVTVNSYHDDGFTEKELAPKLKKIAQSSDNIIEGFYHESLPIIGIMWHPERMKNINDFNKKIINLFLDK